MAASEFSGTGKSGLPGATARNRVIRFARVNGCTLVDGSAVGPVTETLTDSAGRELEFGGTYIEVDDAEGTRRGEALSLRAFRNHFLKVRYTLYNIGLIHKYRGEWHASRDFNQRSVDLPPDDEAANWNLAIAATALRDWTTARAVWRRLGIGVLVTTLAIVAKVDRR